VFGRLTAVAGTLRPRSIARAAKAVDDLVAVTRELRKAVRQLESARVSGEERDAAMQAELKALRDAVSDLQVRESRLRAIYQRDIDQGSSLAALDTILDATAIGAHVARAVENATLYLEPFPHLVLEPLFPQVFYDAVIEGIPPVELFDGAANKRRIVVPFELAPAYGRRVWSFLLDEVIDRTLGPALVHKLRGPLAAWLAHEWPDFTESLLGTAVKMQSTDGRILLRGRGYVIPPHRDPKWGFVTCLLYLARPGDNPTWGTQLYSVDGDTEASSIAPHWIKPETCRLVKDVPFTANTALVFLNSRGAHGAHIPADAEPPSLERYIYQFRLGPTADSIRRMVALLPEDRRERWSGKVADYA
jgi:hypothetical protein